MASVDDMYVPGELFVYVDADRWELGMVKGPNNTGDGYFCWYTRGNTAEDTAAAFMHKLGNAGRTHIEGIMGGTDVDLSGNPLGRQMRRAISRTGMPDTEFCQFSGIGYGWLHSLVARREEPKWVMNMRRFVRATGTSWEELMRL